MDNHHARDQMLCKPNQTPAARSGPWLASGLTSTVVFGSYLSCPFHHMKSFSSSGLCPPTDIYSTIRSALDEWKAARALLATTIQSYQAACTTLHTISASQLHRPPDYTLFEEPFLTVNSELDSLAAEEQTLYVARLSLAATRNKSPMLAPVNTLPPEILASIFALSKAHCVHDDKRSFQNFAAVCTYWRRIALDSTGLWTHIDIGPNTPVYLMKLLFERTKNVPVYLHLFEPDSEISPPPAPKHESLELTVLGSHIHRVCSLELNAPSSFDKSLNAVLNLWLTSGNPNLARSLVVLRPFADSFLSYAEPGENAQILNKSENAKDMLRFLSRLHLYNARFSWDSGLYSRLVDLRLNASCMKVEISLPRLTDILAANPALHTLELNALHVMRPENWSYPPPIVLGCLRSLILVSLDEGSLQLILPLIGLPTPATELNIAVPFTEQMGQVLENFLAQSDVTELYWYNTGPFGLPSWRFVLKPLPRLRNLVLENFWIVDMPRAEASEIASQRSLFSCPPTVVLLRCRVTLDALKYLVVDYGIQDLRLERCRPQKDKESLEYMKGLLLELYPGLRCTISDTDSSSQWVYSSDPEF
ncbi:hypothetical protein FRC08_008735 [Ceratobasidium sp. 394]|nr:hypothetical protein FRC08_008735 [Ceratobasidium sp. 394]